MRVVLYTRSFGPSCGLVDEEHQQLIELRTLARTQGWIVLGEFSDRGAGWLPFSQRKAGRRVLALSGLFDAVVATEARRVERTPPALAATLAICQDRDLAVYFGPIEQTPERVAFYVALANHAVEGEP